MSSSFAATPVIDNFIILYIFTLKMAKICLLLLMAVLSPSTASSTEDLRASMRNNILEQQVLALLETFRETMLTGSDDIPVLDPLEIQHLHVDEDLIDIPGARLTVNDLVVRYLSTFVVDNLSISLTNLILQQYSVQFQGHIPNIAAEVGEYDLFISALGFNIFGRGDGKVEVIEPKVSGSFTFGLWSVTISNMVVNFELSKFEPQLTGLFDHEGASSFANAFLANLVPELVIQYKNEISEFISPLIQGIANELLEDVSIGDLFPQFQEILNEIQHKSVNGI